MLPAGALIGGEYRIVRLLGRGGMGEVYEAVHERLQRRVAVKTVRGDIAVDPAVLARFRREAETAASLGHPNIVQVTDFEAPPGEPAFLVMEHLEGLALADVIHNERKLAPGRAAFIGMQLLSGLEAAHRAGIVHRDIKPGNIFLLSTFAVRDMVKIVDFGIAKMVSDVAATSRRAITDFGQILGTFAYMAPEQASGGHVDARADIFAAGATLFHAISGVRPTEAIVPGQARVPLAKMAPWIAPKLAAIIDKAMERRPEDRFASAQEMADALAPFVDQEPSPGSMTIPEVTFRDTIKEKREPSRFTEETKATDGSSGTALMPPMRISREPPPAAGGSAPRLSAPAPPPSAPHPPSSPAPLRGYSSWIHWVVGIFVGIVALAIAGMTIWQQHVVSSMTSPAATPATTPAVMEKSIEQKVVDGMKLPACPRPETCTQQREGTTVYPVCTKTAPLGRPVVGSFVLVKTNDDAFAGYVTKGIDEQRVVVQKLVGSQTMEVGADQLSKLCH